MGDAADESTATGLEERLRELERDGRDRDFDTASWWWMLILGALLPVTVMLIGWLYHPAGR